MKPTFYSFFLLLTLMLATPLHAANTGKNEQSISKQQAMEIAQQQNPGRVLTIKRKGDVYRVKILNSNGEVRTVLVNANTKTANGK